MVCQKSRCTNLATSLWLNLFFWFGSPRKRQIPMRKHRTRLVVWIDCLFDTLTVQSKWLLLHPMLGFWMTQLIDLNAHGTLAPWAKAKPMLCSTKSFTLVQCSTTSWTCQWNPATVLLFQELHKCAASCGTENGWSWASAWNHRDAGVFFAARVTNK